MDEVLDVAGKETSRLLRAGHYAAAWILYEEAGRLRWAVEVDEHVKARVRGFALHVEGGERIDVIGPLAGVWRVPQLGVLEDIASPHRGAYFWHAVALGDHEGRPVYAVATDLRGIAAFPLSRRGGRELRQKTLGTVLATQIDGAAERRRRAIERLGGSPHDPGEDVTGIMASTLFEYFSGPAVADGGPTLAWWRIAEIDSQAGEHRVLARSPNPWPGESKRSATLFDAFLTNLEREAFGQGINSPRSNKTHFPLLDEDDRSKLPGPGRRDPSLGRADVRWDAATKPDFSAASIDRAALADLIGRARLTERERQVLQLRLLDGLTHKEVAALLGVAEGTVKSWDSRIRKKLDEAAGM